MQDMGCGVFYEIWVGNCWFGNWLLDDCFSYCLVEIVGQLVMMMFKCGGYMLCYEDLLGVVLIWLVDVYFDELLIFEDYVNNSYCLKWVQDMCDWFILCVVGLEKFGVFLLCGNLGDLCYLMNEIQIVECMVCDFGFCVMFFEDYSVEELMIVCCDVCVIVGVEGSQLNYGVVVMLFGGILLMIQLLDCVIIVMKLMIDCWQQCFVMVVV